MSAALDRIRTWLQGCADDAVRELAGARSWCPVEGGLGVSVRIELDVGVVRLSAREPDELPAWLRRDDVAVNASSEPMPAPPALHAVLVALRSRLERAPLPSLAPALPRGRAPALLHRAAFYAHQIVHHDARMLPIIERHDGASVREGRALVLQEQYPFVAALGVPTSTDEVHEGWRATARRIREGTAPPHLGVYVHVPFCTTRCRFCYCSMSDSMPRGTLGAYVDALVEELHRHGPLLDGVPVTSVYVGGGTPSLLPRAELARLFAALRASFTLPSTTQIAMETHPDSLTVEKIELLAREAGVTRLTLGVQTVDPEAQRRANRFHSADKVRELAKAIRAAGLLLHVDIMVGMDGQSFEAFQRDVELALSLEPDSLHLSPFRAVDASGRADPAAVALRARMLAWAEDVVSVNGLRSHLGYPPSRSDAAVNAQLVEARDRVASIVPFGVAAYGGAYGSHAYQISSHARMPGIDAAVSRLVRREVRAVDAFAMDDREEAHRFLVHTLRDGFSLSWFRRWFRCDPWQLAPERWALLEELGALSVEGDRVVSHVTTHADRLLYGALLYGPRVEEAIERRFGRAYDASAPYEEQLRALCLGAA
jgi:coproporphyrinogen III oxidase-like Fe-S oxidoreductase